SREARRGRVAARRRAPQGAARAIAGGHRSLSRDAAQRQGVALHLDERAARVWHRLARFVSHRTDSAAESHPLAALGLLTHLWAGRSPVAPFWSADPSLRTGATGPPAAARRDARVAVSPRRPPRRVPPLPPGGRGARTG